MKILTFFGIVFCFTASYLLADDSVQPQYTKLVPIPIEYQLQTASSKSIEPKLIQSIRVIKPTPKSTLLSQQALNSHVGIPDVSHPVMKTSKSKSQGTHQVPSPYLRNMNFNKMHPSPKRSPLRTRFSMIDSGTIIR